MTPPLYTIEEKPRTGPALFIPAEKGIAPWLVLNFALQDIHNKVVYEFVGDELDMYKPVPSVVEELEKQYEIWFGDRQMLRVIVHDQGLRLGLPINDLATRLYGVPGQVIPGNVVLLEIE